MRPSDGDDGRDKRDLLRLLVSAVQLQLPDVLAGHELGRLAAAAEPIASTLLSV